jgi:hypothetical protein
LEHGLKSCPRNFKFITSEGGGKKIFLAVDRSDWWFVLINVLLKKKWHRKHIRNTKTNMLFALGLRAGQGSELEGREQWLMD